MNGSNEAVIVLSKCTNKHRTYGIRTEKIKADNWLFTWAFPMKEDSAAREGYDRTNIKGNIQFSAEYPGCPYCGSGNLVVCQCGRLNCASENEVFTCAWCGIKGSIGKYDGGRITAGMDA